MAKNAGFLDVKLRARSGDIAPKKAGNEDKVGAREDDVEIVVCIPMHKVMHKALFRAAMDKARTLLMKKKRALKWLRTE